MSNYEKYRKSHTAWVKANFPKKCEHCDYISNNPSMHYYHKRIHSAIPEGRKCDHGCGQLAKFMNTGGKFTCEKIAHHCPEYLRIHSQRIENQWKNADERRIKTRKTFFKHCCGVPEVIAKQKKTLQNKWGNFTPEQKKDFRHYARHIRQRAQVWAKEQGHLLGRQTLHVDHKLSVFDAWKAGLEEGIVNHPANLRVIDAKLNCSKGAKSSLTLNELLIEIQNFNQASLNK